MQWILYTLYSFLALTAPIFVYANELNSTPHYRIGLVLGGGGAKGIAHIGVLKALEKLRIPIHAIAGTSMGALVGGAYASGVPLKEMEQRIIHMDWDEMFMDDPPRPMWPMRRKHAEEYPTWDFTIGRRNGEFQLPKAAISGQKVQLFLASLVQNTEGIINYDAMPIPFRAIATNLENGQLKVFDRGPLASALRASMSVPGLFAPLENSNGLYVDGGLVRNLPIDIARQMGVNVIIAVNLGSSYLKRERLNNILGITNQMIAILIEQNAHQSLTELNPNYDVLITPELDKIESTDFNRGKDTIPIGEQAVLKVEDKLRRYQINPTAYAQWQAARLRLNRTQPKRVAEVRVVGLKAVNPKIFNQLKHNYAQQPLNRERLEQDLQKLYSSGDFERIGYSLEGTGQNDILTIEAKEKSWGPNYLNFGLELMNDHQGDSRFGLRTTYRQTWLNTRGAEWTTSLIVGNTPGIHSELYQPLFVDQPYFILPYVDAGITPLHIYNNKHRIARYDTNAIGLGAELGTSLNTNWELKLGPYWQQRRFVLDTGLPIWPTGKVQETGMRSQLIFDNLDSGHVPSHGQRFTIEYQYPFQVTGGPDTYQLLYAKWQGAYPLGKGSIMGMVRIGSSLGTDIPYYDQFALGGFLNLTGYANEQFRGSESLYSSLTYHQLITALPSTLGRGLYWGGSLEVGQVWNQDQFVNETLGEIASSVPNAMLYSASVFLGADTSLGPMYLGWGLSATGNSSLYVLLGQRTW